MTTRKTIGKGLRFDVFKRDGFTCQYCGQKPPDVVLHVDHILAVSLGGDNDISNLITSCESCNQGKKAKRLESSPKPDASVAWLEMQQEISELRIYQEAKAQRDLMLNEIIDDLQRTWVDTSGLSWYPSSFVIRQMLNAYSPEMVEEAFMVVAPKASGKYVPKNGVVQYIHGVLRNLSAE